VNQDNLKYTFTSLSPVQITTLLAALDLAAGWCDSQDVHKVVSRGEAFKQLSELIKATLRTTQD
jgi:hypothetical protein